MTNETTKPEITYAHKADPSGQRFRQFASAPVPDWAVDVRPVSDETTKPVVTQADRFKAKPQPDIDRDAVSERMFEDFKQTFDGLAHASQAVVSQDLVPVAVDDLARQVASYVDVGTRERTNVFNAARSAIEAAQIAARNEALDEAATVASDGETLHRLGDSKDWRDGYETACNYIAAAIRTLRTPSQHQD